MRTVQWLLMFIFQPEFNGFGSIMGHKNADVLLLAIYICFLMVGP